MTGLSPSSSDPMGEVHGPRADADWLNATVTLEVPVHGTAITQHEPVQVTLAQLKALLEQADG